MARRHVPVVIAIGIMVAMTACTSHAPKPTPGPTATPRPTATVTAHVNLECSQGNASDSPISPGLLVTDTVGTVFVHNPVGHVPRAKDVGIPSPSSAAWRFNKSPLLLAANARKVTISVPDDGRQYLLWVPTSDWVGNPTSAMLRAWITHEVTASGCDSQPVAFLGGVLAIDPTRCFPLRIESTGGARDVLDVRADGRSCST